MFAKYFILEYKEEKNWIFTNILSVYLKGKENVPLSQSQHNTVSLIVYNMFLWCKRRGKFGELQPAFSGRPYVKQETLGNKKFVRRLFHCPLFNRA